MRETDAEASTEVLVQVADVHAALSFIDSEFGFYPDGPARTNPELVRLGQATGWKPEQNQENLYGDEQT